jgi:hypothetical protein
MDPDYISGSPSVMSYDYTSGDYFSPAYLGQQTPQQAALAAVKAADPILASMPATAPLVAHPVPGYPKQGHVPTFTTPMNVGEWNIKGVNMPTYAPALPPMPGSDWRTFPQPIDGRQLSPARPQFSAYAGMDFGAAQIDYVRPGFGQSREVQDGAYRYRQFADGAVMILVSERPDLLAPGTILTANNPADPNYRRWVAITTKIGSWKDFAKARGSAILQGAAQATGTVKQLAKAKKRRKRRAPGGSTPSVDLPDDGITQDVEESSFRFFSGPLPWVVGGVVVVGLVLLFSRGGQEKSRGSKD